MDNKPDTEAAFVCALQCRKSHYSAAQAPYRTFIHWIDGHEIVTDGGTL
jgi:hypothetical protein